MAGQYDNTNRGALFLNKRKTQGDNRPDWTGKIDIDGQEFFISAWEKMSNRTGERYLSLARQTQDNNRPNGAAGGGAQQPRGGKNDKPAFNDDDIPF
jgi:hypothetical protein